MRNYRFIKIAIIIVGIVGFAALGLLYFKDRSKESEITFTQPPNIIDRVVPSANQILSFNAILKEPMNAVVNISTKTEVANNQLQMMFNDPLFREFFGKRFGNIPNEQIQRGLGSGVILTTDGYIITNNHVIAGADEVKVTLQNSTKEYDAKIIGVDQGSDLAVIKIDASGLNPIKMANINDVKVGDIVFAIGNPFGVGETVTQGIISALNKHGLGINQYENFIQTDASINPGNSGGALVDSRGYLIGINSAIFSKGGGNDGIGFTIPVDMVQNVVSQLIKDGKVTRGYMGVSLATLNDDARKIYISGQGAIVTEVEQNSPAQKAGIQRGDLITAIDGLPVDSAVTLQSKIGAKKPNDIVAITIERNKKIETLSVSLADRDKALSEAFIEIKGLKLSKITKEIESQLNLPSAKGAIVIDVDPSSSAAEAGFERGDVIVQIENSPIGSPEDIKKILESNKKHRVYVSRNGIMGIIVL